MQKASKQFITNSYITLAVLFAVTFGFFIYGGIEFWKPKNLRWLEEIFHWLLFATGPYLVLAKTLGTSDKFPASFFTAFIVLVAVAGAVGIYFRFFTHYTHEVKSYILLASISCQWLIVSIQCMVIFFINRNHEALSQSNG